MQCRTIALAAIALAVSLPAVTDASAMAQRTFGASNGNDANPCSLAQPCRSFASAIAQTIGGGEVIVVDSAGYGPVTITQSVSIVAPAGIYAGVSVPSGVGITIAGAGINVALRGLTINNTSGGLYGILMTDGAELTAANCVISNFSNVRAGVTIQVAATVKIAETVVRDNTFGIIVGYGATANITNSQVLNSGSEGIVLAGGPSGTGTTTNIFIADTLVTGTGPGVAGTFCIDNFASPGTTGNISATRVTVTACGYAIDNEPQGAGTMTVSNSMVTGNFNGFLQVSGTFNSVGNNHLSGNMTDTTGSITTIGTK